MKIWITRGDGSRLQSRGLEAVFVWFHEPCLKVSETLDYFENGDGHKELEGILYGRNCRYNFIYRSDNDRLASFGDKLIRNDDGIDFPEILEQYRKEHKLQFEHEVFGSGHIVGYSYNNARILFGYPDQDRCPDVAKKIWELVEEDFKGIPFDDWDKAEKDIPWWRFCKQIEIDIKLV